MASLQIIVGSMLGGSEYVAEACEEILSSLNHRAEVHLSPDFSQIPIENQTWLICTSTHGAGEYQIIFKPLLITYQNQMTIYLSYASLP